MENNLSNDVNIKNKIEQTDSSIQTTNPERNHTVPDSTETEKKEKETNNTQNNGSQTAEEKQPENNPNLKNNSEEKKDEIDVFIEKMKTKIESYKNIEDVKNIIDTYNNNIKEIEEKYQPSGLKETELEIKEAEESINQKEERLKKLRNELKKLDTSNMTDIERQKAREKCNAEIDRVKNEKSETEKVKKQAIEKRDNILNNNQRLELTEAELQIKKAEENINIASLRLERLKEELNNIITNKVDGLNINEMNSVKLQLAIEDCEKEINRTESEKAKAEEVRNQAIEKRNNILNKYSKHRIELENTKKQEILDNESNTKKELILSTKEINPDNYIGEINNDINKINVKIDKIKREMNKNTYEKYGETFTKNHGFRRKLETTLEKLFDQRNQLCEKRDNFKETIDLCNGIIREIDTRYEKQAETINKVLKDRHTLNYKEPQPTQGEEQQPGTEEQSTQGENQQPGTEQQPTQGGNQQPGIEKQPTQGGNQQPGTGERQEHKNIVIIIDEKGGKLTYKDKEGKEITESLKLIKEEKKSMFKRLDIPRLRRNISFNIFDKIKLYRKINPAIIKALGNNEQVIENYIKCLRDKKKFEFDLIHKTAGLSGFKKFKLRKYTKLEKKCGAEIVKKFDKNKTLGDGKADTTDEKYKDIFKNVSPQKELSDEELKARHEKIWGNNVKVSEEVKENLQKVSEAYATKGNGMTSEELAQNISPYLEK